MSQWDKSYKKSDISDSNQNNKYYRVNKWKKNNWYGNVKNYGNSNYRNSDYGSGHTDNR